MYKYGKVKAPPLLIVVAGDLKECPEKAGLMHTLSCAAENILLAVESLSLGGVWLYVYDDEEPEVEERVKDILSIPEEMLVVCMLPIGSPDKDKETKNLSRDGLHFNKWEKL